MNPLEIAVAAAGKLGLDVELVPKVDPKIEAYPGDVAYVPPSKLYVAFDGRNHEATAYYIFHELGHWVAAAEEERTQLNFGDPAYEQEDQACAVEAWMIETLTGGELRHWSSHYSSYSQAYPPGELDEGRRLLEEQGMLELFTK